MSSKTTHAACSTVRHAVANLGKRERLQHDVDDNAVEIGSALALVGVARDQQNAQAGKAAYRRLGHRYAVHSGHADVGHDQVEAPVRRVDLVVAALTVLGDGHDVPGPLQGARSKCADGFIVLDDQYVCHVSFIAGKL